MECLKAIQRNVTHLEVVMVLFMAALFMVIMPSQVVMLLCI
jgi:hypothetical protein